MIATPFLIGIFVLAFRSCMPRSVWRIAAGIPCLIIAGLLATNFFEPAAQSFAMSSGPLAFLGSEADFVIFMALFMATLGTLNKVLGSFPDLPCLSESFEIRVRLFLSFVASYLFVAIILTACDTSPRLQSGLDLRPDSAAFLGIVAPDAQWLSFSEFVADGSMSRRNRPIPPSLDSTFQSGPVGRQIQTLRQRYVPASAEAVSRENPATHQPAREIAVQNE